MRIFYIFQRISQIKTELIMIFKWVLTKGMDLRIFESCRLYYQTF